MILTLPLFLIGMPTVFLAEMVKDFWWEVVRRREQPVVYGHATHRAADWYMQCVVHGLVICVLALLVAVFCVARYAK